MDSLGMNLGKESRKETNMNMSIRDNKSNWGCDCGNGEERVLRYLVLRVGDT